MKIAFACITHSDWGLHSALRHGSTLVAKLADSLGTVLVSQVDIFTVDGSLSSSIWSPGILDTKNVGDFLELCLEIIDKHDAINLYWLNFIEMKNQLTDSLHWFCRRPTQINLRFNHSNSAISNTFQLKGNFWIKNDYGLKMKLICKHLNHIVSIIDQSVQ